MDKLFELLGRLFPLLPYYPRWVRILAALTLAMILFTVFLLAVWYSKAVRIKDWETQVRPTVEKQAAAAQQLFSLLGGALSTLHTSAIQLRYDLLDYTRALPDLRHYLQENPQFLEQEAVAPLSLDTERFLGDLDRLRAALKAIQMDPLAQACWVQSSVASNGALAYVGRQLTDRGFPREEADIRISNIPQILDFLSIAPGHSHLGGLKFGPLISAILATNVADTPGVGKPYNNEALRVLVFEGNLIASIEQPSPNQKKMVLVPIGAAILQDIFNSIPDGQTVRNVLSERNGKYSVEIKKTALRFDRNETVSEDFRFAADSLQRRQDVLVLDLSR